MVFAEQPGTPMRWLVSVVVEMFEGDAWAVVEIEPIPCPGRVVPTGVLAELARQLSAMQN